MKGSVAVISLVTLVFVIVFGMLLYIFFVKPQNNHSNYSAGTTAVSPTITIRDFAPEVPMTQKTTILIQSSDSSEEKYIVPTAQINTYIKQLPPGYHVVSKIP